MAYFLVKTEPSEYAWEDLVRDRRTIWDGVTHPMALKHLATAKPDDLAAFYHTGTERRVVGIVKVVPAAVIAVEPVTPLAVPVTLDDFKAAKAFKDSPLVKMGRLSVVPLSAAQWKSLLAMGKTKL